MSCILIVSSCVTEDPSCRNICSSSSQTFLSQTFLSQTFLSQTFLSQTCHKIFVHRLLPELPPILHLLKCLELLLVKIFFLKIYNLTTTTTRYNSPPCGKPSTSVRSQPPSCFHLPPEPPCSSLSRPSCPTTSQCHAPQCPARDNKQCLGSLDLALRHPERAQSPNLSCRT